MKKKKLLIIALVTLLPNLAISQQIRIVPASTSVSVGDEFTLNIRISDIVDLFCFQLDISYNQEVLEFLSVGEGNFLNNQGQASTYWVSLESGPGLISNIACTRMGQIGGIDGNGVLTSIRFRAIEIGTSDMVLQNVILGNSSFYGMDYSKLDGEVEVVGSSNCGLTISAATGPPGTSEGGNTSPSLGHHLYSIGRTVSIEAIPYTDYRLSKWSGDVNNTFRYNERITIVMDSNKSVTANFYTRCGDLNGNNSVTPADAQAAFDIFLGRTLDPSDCQKENADVNCDGTKIYPLVTPGDAQAIFDKFLGKSELPCDCSGNSRQSKTLIKTKKISARNLLISNIEAINKDEISIPIIIDNPQNVSAFGFDLIFPSDSLEFITLEKSDLLKNFYQVDGFLINDGVIRIGGYGSDPIATSSSDLFVTLIFKIIGDTKEQLHFEIVNKVDDLRKQ